MTSPFAAPFVYVASLRRTGSTLVSEALTEFPRAFVFREPRLAEGRFAVKRADAELWARHGVDLSDFAARWSGDGLLSAFREKLLPRLHGVVQQVGVKEIRHRRWRRYAEHFPDMRVILTGRDPRDIYLSLRGRVVAGRSEWAGEFSPRAVAEHLNRQFGYQLEMQAETTCLAIRYEDLCTDETAVERLRSFALSPVEGVGSVGAFNASNPNRRDEFALHGDAITEQRVARWAHERDPELLRSAHEAFKLMPRYCEFWGYDA